MDLDVKIKEENVKIKVEKDESRKDPTSFLPEEPMTYEIKKKKKKKKKKKEEDDPFKDIEDKMGVKIEPITLLDPEVKIKVEDIEVELDFNDVSVIVSKTDFCILWQLSFEAWARVSPA